MHRSRPSGSGRLRAPSPRGLLLCIALLPGALVGCARRDPAPLVAADAFRAHAESRASLLARLANVVRAPSAEDAATTPTVGALFLVEPGADGFARDLEAIALERAPSLRVARAHLAAVEAEARLAGLPPDPTLSFDALRVLDSLASTPWLLAGGLQLPLGSLILAPPERRAAMARLEVERATLATRESEVLAETRTRLVDLLEAREEVAIRERLADRLALIVPLVQALGDSGEIRRVDARAFVLEHVENDRASIRARADAVRAAGELGRALGVPGCVPEDFAGAGLPAVDPPPREELIARLANSPGLRAPAAEYLAASALLDRERRAIFADAAAGPRYEYEEGVKRIGANASISIPLWNRNRAAIAGAKARVEAARAAWEGEAIDASARLETLLADAESLRADLAVLESDLIPAVRVQVDEVERLAGLGDLDVFLLLDALVRSRDAERELVRARAALARARIEIERLAPVAAGP